MHVLNTKKYVIYTQSNFRICDINYDEKLLLKLIIAGSYIILSLLSGFFEDSCLSTKKEKLFQEFHSKNLILKKMSVRFEINLWKDKWGGRNLHKFHLEIAYKLENLRPNFNLLIKLSKIS